jgi:hypothetical protein
MTAQRQYLRYASQCLGYAEKANSIGDREMLLEMADAWTRIAAFQHDDNHAAKADTAIGSLVPS